MHPLHQRIGGQHQIPQPRRIVAQIESAEVEREAAQRDEEFGFGHALGSSGSGSPAGTNFSG
jgi:hypothetical protein